MTKPVLSLRDVSIHITNACLLDSLNLDLYAGKTTALVGESGSGKSISAMSILKLLPDNMHVTGQALFNGEDIWQLDDTDLQSLRRDDISFIFQEPMTALNPLHTVDRQIGECIHDSRYTNNAQLSARIIELLDLAQISEPRSKLKSYPHQLSGGQRQRVMIAMALAKEPKLLIADEPTTAIDVTVQKDILDLLKALQAQLGLSMLLITHDIHLVKLYSDYVCVLKSGKTIEQQSTQALFKQPKASYTQSLINETNLSPPSKPSKNVIIKLESIDSWYPLPRTSFIKKPDFQVLHDINFTLHKGETLGIIGESGSGKTTLANVLLKLQAAEGSYTLLNQDILPMRAKEFNQLRPNIQVVFQDPFASLSPRMTVLDIISEGLLAHNQHRKLSKQAIKEKVLKILEQVDMDKSCLHQYPHEFSGGQRQRIAIARAIILEPQCIILDEPTSALDRNIQQQVLELIQHLQHSYNIAFVLISHDLQLVKQMAHQVLILKEGRVIEQGETQALFHAPQHAYTQTLLSAYPAYITAHESDYDLSLDENSESL